ncbi:Putative oxidoreductase CatD [Arenibacter antarcticus]|uniref:DoxX family protein n=1 Tax=Arenibacter antarcticus TaxID=2040469 RepID=A0ABW5VHM3_9FLAO|nr:DoxX family protein [Arenibacter sp. H213]MCM4168279.1 DoxX family protein [Arenibacter sp. H213]
MKDFGLLLLRVGFAVLMLTHGIPKFLNLIQGNFEFGNPLGIGAAPSLFLAVIGEFICPILVIIGIRTRWASVPIILTMMVALFIVHANDPIGVKEKAILFLVGFTSILLLGPGKYSLDKK